MPLYDWDMQTILPALMTAQDVGLWLTLPANRVERLARQGKIPCVVLPSGDLLFDPVELNQWLQSLRSAKKNAWEAAHVC
jgi:hypothetical protein